MNRRKHKYTVVSRSSTNGSLPAVVIRAKSFARAISAFCGESRMPERDVSLNMNGLQLLTTESPKVTA
jgi:hypothetical protein